MPSVREGVSLAGSGPFRSWRPDFEPARSSSDRGAKKPKMNLIFSNHSVLQL